MRQDNLYFDAQPRLQSGIAKIARAVGVTMGTGGSNAIIEAIESPGHLMTNDGYTIASSIYLADPIENMARNMLLEAINRANKSSGDGSSTTCVLTAKLIDEGIKAQGDMHPMDIKRQMEECLPLIEESLEEQSRVITVQDVGQVATISAEDPAIGAMIQEIYEKIGKTGIVYWDISKTSTDTYTIGSGITVEGAGFLSPYMCDATETGQSTNQVRIKEAKVLITKQKITNANDFGAIAQYLDSKDIKDLVVFADEVDPLVVPDIVKTRMVRGFRIIIVKMPVLWKDWWFEDLALATGATIADPALGLPLKMLKEEHLGTVGNLVVTKDDTFLDGIKDVSAHVLELEKENTDDSLLRAARLNTKTARYFVGAASDSALSYRRLKVEDAIAAAYQALNGGIVAGGGVALLNAAYSINPTLSVGASILYTALKEPFNRITSNAGINTDGWARKVFSNQGFDTRTREEVDMFEAGITDPKNVVLNAVKNAISVAAAIITAPTIVTLPREEEQQPQLPQGAHMT